MCIRDSDNTLQVPTPTNGVFPFKVVLPVLTHIVCDTPAFAIVGTSSVWMLIVAVELAQTPFAMLHCNIVVPTVNPVIVELGLFGEVTTPLPDNTLQVPTPTNGVFPFKVCLLYTSRCV